MFLAGTRQIRLPFQLIRWFGAAFLLFVFSCYGALWLKSLILPQLIDAVPPSTNCSPIQAQVRLWYNRAGNLGTGALAGAAAAALSHVLFRKSLKGHTMPAWYLGTILSMALAFAVIFFGIEVIEATSGEIYLAPTDTALQLQEGINAITPAFFACISPKANSEFLEIKGCTNTRI
jgi:hypothetical protein